MRKWGKVAPMTKDQWLVTVEEILIEKCNWKNVSCGKSFANKDLSGKKVTKQENV